MLIGQVASHPEKRVPLTLLEVKSATKTPAWMGGALSQPPAGPVYPGQEKGESLLGSYKGSGPTNPNTTPLIPSSQCEDPSLKFGGHSHPPQQGLLVQAVCAPHRGPSFLGRPESDQQAP